METSFVAQSVLDVAGRFTGLLLVLLGISIVQTAALEVVFGTRVWRQAFDRKSYNPKPWVSMGVGIILALGTNFNPVFYLLGLSEPEVVQALAARADLGLINFMPANVLIFCCLLLGGLAWGGGPKVVLAMADLFGRYRERITKSLAR